MEKIFELAEKAAKLNNKYTTTFSGTGSENRQNNFTFKDFTVMSVAGEVISLTERMKTQYQMAKELA